MAAPVDTPLPMHAHDRPARARLLAILDRASLVVLAASTLYWMWVRICASESLSGIRLAIVSLTIAGLLAAIALGFRKERLSRRVARLLVTACAAFWLASLFHTGGNTVYYLDRDLPMSLLFKIMLCTSACFAMSYLLAMSLYFMRCYPVLVRQACVLAGGLAVVLVSIDLWFCIDPPVEPAVVGEYLYRRQYHPVFTYAVQDTYVTRDPRERMVRDYNGTQFHQSKPPHTLRIILSGASTVWGHGLEKPQTLRSQIESALKTRHPDRNWEVLCVAYQGKFQLNELVDTVAVLPQWQPDLVISLNGYNEIWYGETPGRYFGQPFIDDQTRLRFGESLFGRLSHIGPVHLALDTNPSLIPGTEIDPQLPALFYGQLRMTARTLKGLRIPYAFSFCPNVFELSDASPSERTLYAGLDKPAANTDRLKSTVARERRAASDRIIREEGQISFDVMQMLPGGSPNRFIDECHLTAEATGALAGELVQQIPVWLQAALSVEDK